MDRFNCTNWHSAFFLLLSDLFSYDWQTVLCQFKMSSKAIWLTYIIKRWSPFKFSEHPSSHTDTKLNRTIFPVWWKLLGLTALRTLIYDMEHCSSFWRMWNRMSEKGVFPRFMSATSFPFLPYFVSPLHCQEIMSVTLTSLAYWISRVWLFVTQAL